MSARVRELPVSRPLRLGFVGLGWIGRARLDAVSADAAIEVAALHDADATRVAELAAAHPQARPAGTMAELCAADLDGVVIATPNGVHAEQAIACFERGLAVFCQKPLATTAPEARAIVAAAERADRLLGVDYCYRHVAGMVDLRRRVQAGEFGRLLAIDLTFHNAYGPDKAWCLDRRLAGGGCLLDLGVHLLDLASWLQGGQRADVRSVARYANGRRLPAGEPAVEELAFATLEQPDGTTVRIACSWHAQSGRDAIIEVRLLGTHGGAVWSNVGGSFYDFELHAVRGPRAERLAGGPDAWGPRALRDWVARVRTGARFEPDAYRHVEVAELVDGLYSA
jgi:predicted dehydrogenase